jgi:hypothetical protein
MKHTFLASRELASFSSDGRVKALWQRLDKLENVGVAADLLDLLLCDFRNGLDRTEQNVKAHSTRVQRRFLRHQRDLLPVLLEIEVRDQLSIELTNQKRQ